MAEVGEVIFGRLTAHAGTSALIGSRCYPDLMPQNPTLPAVVYSEISNPRISEGSLDLFRVRMQIDCWASSRAGANALRAQARSALRGYADKAAGVGVIGMLDDDGFADREPETALFRASFDVMVTVCG